MLWSSPNVASPGTGTVLAGGAAGAGAARRRFERRPLWDREPQQAAFAFDCQQEPAQKQACRSSSGYRNGFSHYLSTALLVWMQRSFYRHHN